MDLQVFSTTPFLFDLARYLTDLVAANFPLLCVLGTILKIIAVKTGDPGANRIADLYTRAVNSVRGGGLLLLLFRYRKQGEDLDKKPGKP